MSNSFFQFKRFRIEQDRCAMKVSTDACLFGAWVAEQIRQENISPGSLLDIGAGTGLLSLMIAQKNPESIIRSVEIDKKAADQARENVCSSPWANRIEIIEGDVRALGGTERFERIISNPPFYEGDLTGPDSRKNQAHHDASLSFDELAESIDRLLAENGKFYLLLPMKRIELRTEYLKSKGLNVDRRIDLQHSEETEVKRVFLSGGRGLAKMPVGIPERIRLMDESGVYTSRVRALLQDYYLAF